MNRLIDPSGRQGETTPDVTSKTPPEVAAEAPPVMAQAVDMAAVARERFPASPIEDIPFPTVDLAVDSCVDAILSSAEFAAAGRYFHSSLSARRSLVSASSQALFYALLRNMRPEHVVEIGTYRASTTEAMCRALHANGRGLVHTIEPYVSDWVPHIMAQWPEELRNRVRFYPMNSAAFFAECRFHPDFVFIDGHHDFEYALFDMQATARFINAGGLVAIDNISQPGPLLAAQRFCRDNPGWSEIGSSLSNYREGRPFDPGRSTIVGTDCCMLRAPRLFTLRPQRRTLGRRIRAQLFGADRFDGEAETSAVGLPTVYMPELCEISVVPVGKAKGTLFVQCIVRTFSDPPHEQTIERRALIEGGPQTIAFDPPLRPVVEGAPFMVEVWLDWVGPHPLTLANAPTLR